jgi:hypothetical protein
VNRYWDDDFDDAAVAAFHLLGLGPEDGVPDCSRCGRPVERDEFDDQEVYENALAVGLCKECLEDTGL